MQFLVEFTMKAVVIIISGRAGSVHEVSYLHIRGQFL